MQNKIDTAIDPRIIFAAERTMLAWIRTGLSLMGFGFVVARFSLFLREMAAANPNSTNTSHGASMWLGVALVGLGVAVNLLAGIKHHSQMKALKSGANSLELNWTLSLSVALVLGAVGILMLGYLIKVSL